MYPVIGGIAYYTNKGASFGSKSSKEMIPLVYTTVGYLAVYGFFVFRQGVSKQIFKKYLKKSDGDAKKVACWQKNADRTVGNCHEQMGPFLVSMWMYGSFVNPVRAAVLGAVSVGTLILYPFLYGNEENAPSESIIASTLPRYWLNYYMMLSTVVATLL